MDNLYHAGKEKLKTASKIFLPENEEKKIRQQMETTFEMIRQGEKSLIQTDRNEKVVLVIGRTGVGKSTLINYLSGAIVKADIDEDDNSIKLNVHNQVGDIRVGHSNVSETTIPNKWYDSNSGITFWDCPGFEDTKGPEQDIANAFYIQKLFQNRELKILIVVQNTTFDETRGSAFTDLVGKLSVLLKNFDDFKNGLSLVVTKTLRLKQSNYANKMKKFIEENKNLSSKQIEILKFLSENEDRISLFSEPQNNGILNNEEQVKIINMISTKAEYVQRSQVNISVSDKSLLTVEEMAKSVNSIISSNIRDICVIIEDYYLKYLNVINNAFQISDPIESSNRPNSYLDINLIRNSIQKMQQLNDLISNFIQQSSSLENLKEAIKTHLIDQNSILDKSLYDNLIKNLSYLDFCKQINPNTERNVRFMEWIKYFQDVLLKFRSDYESIIGKMRGNLFIGKDLIKNLVESLKQHFNHLSVEEIRNRSNNLFKNLLKFEHELKNLSEEQSLNEFIKKIEIQFIQEFDLNFNYFDSLKSLCDICQILGEENSSAFRVDLKSQLNILSSNLSNEFKLIVNKNSSELVDSCLELLTQIHELIKTKINNEKETKVNSEYCQALIDFFDNSSLNSDAGIDSLINSLNNNEFYTGFESFESFKSNLSLLKQEPFNSYFDESIFTRKCTQSLRDLNGYVNNTLEILKSKELELFEKLIDQETKAYGLRINRHVQQDSENSILYSQILDLFIEKLHSISFPTNSETVFVSLEDTFRFLNDIIDQNINMKQLVCEIKYLAERLIMMNVPEDPSKKNLTNKFIIKLEEIKTDLKTDYEKAVQDRFGRILDSFKTDLLSIYRIDTLPSLPSLFDLTNEKLFSRLPSTIGEFDEKLTSFENELIAETIIEQDSQKFSQTKTSLEKILAVPNSRNVILSSNFSLNIESLKQRLEREVKNNENRLKRNVSNTLRLIYNSLEMRIKETNSVKDSHRLLKNFLDSFKKIKCDQSVGNFFTQLRENIDYHLEDETDINVVRKLERDTTEVDYLDHLFKSELIQRLEDKERLVEAELNGNQEEIKRSEINKFFKDLSNDVDAYLHNLCVSDENLRLLDRLKAFFKVNTFENLERIGDISDHLEHLWDLILSNPNFKKESKTKDSLESFRSLQIIKTNYNNLQIPRRNIANLSLICESIQKKREDIHKSIESVLDKSFLYLFNGIDTLIQSNDKISNDQYNKELLEKFKSKLELVIDSSEVVRDIVAIVMSLKHEDIIKNFDTSDAFKLGYDSFKNIKDCDLEISADKKNRLNSKITNKIEKLNRKLADLDKRIKSNRTHSFIEHFKHSIEHEISRIKQELDEFDLIKQSLNILKLNLDGIRSITKLNDLVHWLKSNEKILDLLKKNSQSTKDANLNETSFDLNEYGKLDQEINYESKILIDEIFKSIEYMIEWFDLLKNIQFKIKNEFAFDQDFKSRFKTITNLNLNLFLQNLNLKFERKLELNAEELKSLNVLLDEFRYVEGSCKEDRTNTLTFETKYVRISDVAKKLQETSNKIHFIKIYAAYSVYFDSNLTANGCNVSIFSPKWFFTKDEINIDLSGLNGETHSKSKAENAFGYSYDGKSGLKGKDGLNGVPGMTSGSFYGICQEPTYVDDIRKLKFSLNGGNASDGQEGGDGSNGANGTDGGPVYNDKSNNHSNGNLSSTYNTDFGFTYCIKRDVKIYMVDGTNGGAGGNGGDGGHAGLGGKSGMVRIYHENRCVVRLKGDDGCDGKEGKSGKPGVGGSHGRNRISGWDTRDEFWIEDAEKKWSNGYDFLEKTPSKANNGNYGQNGWGVNIIKEMIEEHTNDETTKSLQPNDFSEEFNSEILNEDIKLFFRDNTKNLSNQESNEKILSLLNAKEKSLLQSSAMIRWDSLSFDQM